MRVDIDKLEALEKAATPGPYSVEDLVLGGWQTIDDGEYLAFALNSLPDLLAEVRELRGIAEAAREQRAKVLAAPWRAPWDLVEPLDQALAGYDAGGAK